MLTKLCIVTHTCIHSFWKICSCRNWNVFSFKFFSHASIDVDRGLIITSRRHNISYFRDYVLHVCKYGEKSCKVQSI